MNSISHNATKQLDTLQKSYMSDHSGKLYNKEFRDVIVRYQMKFLKIVCYIYFNQMVFKSSFKKWG